MANQLSYLREDIIIERLTGDGLKEFLLAPDWTLKRSVLSMISIKNGRVRSLPGKELLRQTIMADNIGIIL